MTEVVDLTETDDEKPSTRNASPGNTLSNDRLRMWIAMAPEAKPSIRYGPGRGKGGKKHWFRPYFDNAATQKRALLHRIVTDAMRNHGCQKTPAGVPVAMKVWFFLRRPDSDFISRRRVAGRLKPSALTDRETIVAITPDTDNMGKFFLDAMKGAVHEDDCQTVDLHMFKLRDNEGLCNGRMAVEAGVCQNNVAEMLPSF